MGKFETTVEFYRYREPYPAGFFAEVARRLSLDRSIRLLDVACGPGSLAIGFAPFVGTCTAIDREPAMLKAAKAAAGKAHVDITFLQTAFEDLHCERDSFDFVTIGRALHWLSKETALPVLERIVTPGGRIAICGATASDASGNAWASKFKEVRRAWASDPDESRYDIDMDRWFERSRFKRIDEIAVTHQHEVTISELIGRALSFSITSPAVVGQKRSQFEADLKTSIEPFAEAGKLQEEVIVKATIFACREYRTCEVT